MSRRLSKVPRHPGNFQSRIQFLNKKAQEIFLLGFFIAFLSNECFAQEPPLPPQKYELNLIYIFEGKDPEYVFTVGNSGFKSVESLRNFLGSVPKGSEVRWAPGCERFGKEPLLSSDKEMASFRKFLEDRGIKFTLVPAG